MISKACIYIYTHISPLRHNLASQQGIMALDATWQVDNLFRFMWFSRERTMREPYFGHIEGRNPANWKGYATLQESQILSHKGTDFQSKTDSKNSKKESQKRFREQYHNKQIPFKKLPWNVFSDRLIIRKAKSNCSWFQSFLLYSLPSRWTQIED